MLNEWSCSTLIDCSTALLRTLDSAVDKLNDCSCSKLVDCSIVSLFALDSAAVKLYEMQRRGRFPQSSRPPFPPAQVQIPCINTIYPSCVWRIQECKYKFTHRSQLLVRWIDFPFAVSQSLFPWKETSLDATLVNSKSERPLFLAMELDQFQWPLVLLFLIFLIFFIKVCSLMSPQGCWEKPARLRAMIFIE